MVCGVVLVVVVLVAMAVEGPGGCNGGRPRPDCEGAGTGDDEEGAADALESAVEGAEAPAGGSVRAGATTAVVDDDVAVACWRLSRTHMPPCIHDPGCPRPRAKRASGAGKKKRIK